MKDQQIDPHNIFVFRTRKNWMNWEVMPGALSPTG
jgi:hypothetical protein